MFAALWALLKQQMTGCKHGEYAFHSWCRRYNWHSVDRQVESVAKIKDLPFLHLLPGHGRPGRFADDEERAQYFSDALRAEGFSAEQLATAG